MISLAVTAKKNFAILKKYLEVMIGEEEASKATGYSCLHKSP